MKIEIDDFIRYEIGLGDLTIICGKNNTGKTNVLKKVYILKKILR